MRCDMAGKTVLITGATSGIGKATALELAAGNHRLLLHGRATAKGEAVRDEIARRTGNSRVQPVLADFTSLRQVAEMADRILANHQRLDVLINNAGLVRERYEETEDGVEVTFQVNYLAHFLLTRRLLPLLRESAPARIINVSSIGQARVLFDRAAYRRDYDLLDAYRQSKLAMVLFTFELAERLEKSGVTANAVHPGTLLDTQLVHHARLSVWGKPESGGEVLSHSATSPELEGITGRYFNEKREARADSQAYDREARRRLWQLSEELTAPFLTDLTP